MDKEIYLAGGCFWGVEKYLSCIPGVIETEVGYANGETENPTYEKVVMRHTGHAETVRVVYDARALSLPELLELFYEIIDPTSVNRQGPDRGRQYRSGIYYMDEGEREAIAQSLADLQKKYEKPLAIEAVPLEHFYRAEEYHQKYLDKTPYGYCHIPKAAFERAREYRKEETR